MYWSNLVLRLIHHSSQLSSYSTWNIESDLIALFLLHCEHFWQVSEDYCWPDAAMEVCKPAQQRQTGNGDEYEETSYSWQPGQFKQSATWGSTISQILISVMILLSNFEKTKQSWPSSLHSFHLERCIFTLPKSSAFSLTPTRVSIIQLLATKI